MEKISHVFTLEIASRAVSKVTLVNLVNHVLTSLLLRRTLHLFLKIFYLLIFFIFSIWNLLNKTQTENKKPKKGETKEKENEAHIPKLQTKPKLNPNNETTRNISVRGSNTCLNHNKGGDTHLIEQTVVFTTRRSSPEQLSVDPPEHTGTGRLERRTVETISNQTTTKGSSLCKEIHLQASIMKLKWINRHEAEKRNPRKPWISQSTPTETKPVICIGGTKSRYSTEEKGVYRNQKPEASSKRP